MERLRCWLLCLATTLVVLAGAAAPAGAQAERTPAIGVIDIQAVLRASTAVQGLSRDIEALRDSTQAEMQGRESALRAADVDLAQRRSSLTPEAYADERSKLEAQGVALQRQLQEERRHLDQRFSQGMAQIQQILQQISQDIAQENDLDLILSKSTVIVVRPEFDFTKEALQRLNDRLKAVPLPPVQTGPAQN